MSAQSMEALGYANEVRLGWSALKRDLRTGVLSPGDAVDMACAQGRWLWEVLEAQHRWGPLSVRRAFRRLGIEDLLVAVGDLDGGQRRAVVRMFPCRGVEA